MRPGAVLLAFLIAWGLPAASAVAAEPVVADKPDSVALTVYYDRGVENIDLTAGASPYGPTGLALVSEWRTIEVPAGETVISFRGVAEGIVPQTAALDGLPAKLVESNQVYDLLSPGSLVRRSVGTTVQRITTN